MKIKIRNGNSYWSGTPAELVKWATGPCYNEVMRMRQAAAREYLVGIGFPPSALV
jgi:hypothetical protein